MKQSEQKKHEKDGEERNRGRHANKNDNYIGKSEPDKDDSENNRKKRGARRNASESRKAAIAHQGEESKNSDQVKIIIINKKVDKSKESKSRKDDEAEKEGEVKEQAADGNDADLSSNKRITNSPLSDGGSKSDHKARDKQEKSKDSVRVFTFVFYSCNPKAKD